MASVLIFPDSLLVTARVRAFLPLMAEANRKLDADMRSQPREAFNIENVDESEPHIEMVRPRWLSCVRCSNFLKGPCVGCVGAEGAA